MASGARTQLMFTGEAAAALELYGRVFPAFKVERVERYGPGDQGPEGSIRIAHASLAGHRLAVIDSPVRHAFDFTPSISLVVECESADELDAAFGALAAGRQVFMPLGNYGFSTRFGWCSDRFGVSWQLTLP